MQLDPADGWRIVMEKRMAFGKPYDAYFATNGKTKLQLDRVTSVIEESFGKSEALITYGIQQAMLDFMASFHPKNAGDKDSHLACFDEFSRLVEWMRDQKKETRENGRIIRGKGLNFAELAAQIGYKNAAPQVPERFGWPWLAERAEEALKARYRSKDKAAELGTRSHELIELWIRGGGTFVHYREGQEYTIDLKQEPQEVQNALKAFWEFWDSNEFTADKCELRVFDIRNGIGGTADALVKDKAGKTVLLDWKTSGGIYETNLVQCAAYGRMCEIAGDWPERAYLVRFDKYTAQAEICPVWLDRIDYIRHWANWERCMQTFRWKQATKDYLDDWRASL